MDDLKSEFSYLKGFVEGVKFKPETKQDEIIEKILSFLEKASARVDDCAKELSVTQKLLSAYQGELSKSEKRALETASAELYEVTCPNCGQKAAVPSDEVKGKSELRCRLCESIIFVTP